MRACRPFLLFLITTNDLEMFVVQSHAGAMLYAPAPQDARMYAISDHDAVPKRCTPCLATVPPTDQKGRHDVNDDGSRCTAKGRQKAKGKRCTRWMYQNNDKNECPTIQKDAKTKDSHHIITIRRHARATRNTTDRPAPARHAMLPIDWPTRSTTDRPASG